MSLRMFATCFDTSASLCTRMRGGCERTDTQHTSLHTFFSNISFSFDELIGLLDLFVMAWCRGWLGPGFKRYHQASSGSVV
jgi:hypothetical protein